MVFENSLNNNSGSELTNRPVADLKGKSTSDKTGFLFCPRCGLRRPKSENMDYYGGHCPSCGCRMAVEYYLPYNSRKSEVLFSYSRSGNNKIPHLNHSNQSTDNSNFRNLGKVLLWLT